MAAWLAKNISLRNFFNAQENKILPDVLVEA